MSTKIKLSNNSEKKLTIYIEPEGTRLDILQNETLTLETEHLEIFHIDFTSEDSSNSIVISSDEGVIHEC